MAKGSMDLKSSENRSRTPRINILLQFAAAIIASMGSFANGLMYTWPAVAQPQLQSDHSPLGVPLSDEEISWMTSVMYLVASFSMIPWAWGFGKMSRKLAGYTVGVLYGVHFMLLATAPGVAMLYVGRAVGGLANALLFFFTPAYIKEIAEDQSRGTLGAFFALLFNVGVVVLYGADAVLPYRALTFFCFACCVLFLVLFWWMPETPACLVAQGHVEAASRSLRWLRGPDADVPSTLRRLEAEAEASRRLQQQQSSAAAALRSLFSDRASVRGLLLAAAMCAAQPLSGFFVVLSYAFAIFREAGTPLSPNAAAAIAGAILVVAGAASSWLVERAGRRPLYLFSLTGAAASLATLGGYSFAKASGADVQGVTWLPVLCLALFMAAAAVGIIALPFVVIAEIFLPQAQSMATIIGGTLLLLFGFLATKFFTAFTQGLGLHGCYWLFSGLCMAIATLLFFFLPETKGRSLQSIRKELANVKDDSSESNEEDI